MRRAVLLPAALVVFAVAAVTMGFASVPEPSGPPPPAAPPTAAPVLTARRVPVLLATPFGERRLVEGLREVAAQLPEPSCLEVGEGDRTLFESASAAPVIPASLLKLVTAVAVLAHVDPADTLETVVRAVAPPVDGVVAGDLWLVGGGDPLLGTQEWGDSFERQPQLRTPIEALADRLVAAGVRSVQGRVVGDESRYDAVRIVPSWPDRYRTSNQVGPLSALTVNDGFARVGTRVEPVPDPPQAAAAVLNELLRVRGVEVAGDPASGVAPPEAATELAAVDSPPALALVGQMLRDSDNGTAELLLKEVGLRVSGEGSTAAGAAAAEATLAAMSVPTAGVDVVDGSGLDRGNRLTCDLLAELLRLDADGVEGGLAVAGATGTLAERFLGTPVTGRLRAKTGTLNGVASLAGYADTRNDGELTFAFVQNGGDATATLERQADLASLLVAYPDLPAIEELGPGAWPGLAPP